MPHRNAREATAGCNVYRNAREATARCNVYCNAREATARVAPHCISAQQHAWKYLRGRVTVLTKSDADSRLSVPELQLTEWFRRYFSWSMLAQGAGAGVESALAFGGAAAGLEVAFRLGWVRRFPSA